MPKTNFLIEWDAELVPKDAAVQLSRTFDNIDEKVFKDRVFTATLWASIARKIGKSISNRFKQGGPGWKPLSPDYTEWKKRAFETGLKVKAGDFGFRKVKFTEIGFLTETLHTSATKMNKDANIFEIKDVVGWAGGKFRYAIDGKKLPYARHFDEEREFFFIDAKEADQIIRSAHRVIWNRMARLIKQGKITR